MHFLPAFGVAGARCVVVVARRVARAENDRGSASPRARVDMALAETRRRVAAAGARGIS